MSMRELVLLLSWLFGFRSMGSTKDLETNVSSAPLSSAGSSDRDDNYEVYQQTRALEYTPEEAKKVLRKIDLRLMPLLFLIYLLQVRRIPLANHDRILILSSISTKTVSISRQSTD